VKRSKFIGLTVVALALAGCSGAAAGGGLNGTTPTTAVSHRAIVGSTIKLIDKSSLAYDVTLVKVTPNARPDIAFDKAPAGQVIFGAQFKITGVTGTEADSVDNDSQVIGTNGKTYESAGNGIAGCVDFNNGTFTVNPGQSAEGCEAFDVPKSVKIAKVEWTTDSGSGSVVVWSLTGP
jgi:hypothetical protein